MSAAQSDSHRVGASVAMGSRVILVVSRGPSQGPRGGAVPVPMVVGSAQGDALNHLQDRRLNSQVFNDYSDTVRRGHVIDQYPIPGASTAADTEVVLLVSSGPAEATAPVALPDVVGLDEATATRTLTSAGLEPESVHQHHPNVAAGVVFAQLPSQSSVAAPPKRGGLMWLWIVLAVVAVALLGVAAYFFLAPKDVTVPKVTGVSQANAATAITGAGLKLGSVTPLTGSGVKVGDVVSQDPAAGAKVRQGSAVNLAVAVAEPTIAVPSVVGLASADAQSQLAAAGFTPQTANKYSDSVALGNVIDQSPAAGLQAKKGAAVTISISLGPKNTNVTLPDLVGQTQSAAVKKLTALGLTARISQSYSSKTPAGEVTDQIPPAGQSVAPGTTVGLNVSQGPAPSSSVTVPSVIGQNASNAQSALQALGLNATLVQWDGTGKPTDQVAGQAPPAGEQVAAGSTIVVFVSSGK